MNASVTPAECDALVVFGATGDLAYKQIFPALLALVQRGALRVPVIGVANSPWNTGKLRERARSALEHHGGIDGKAFEHLSKRLSYVAGEYADSKTFERLRDALGGAKRPLYYLAIPPSTFTMVVEGLQRAGLSGGARVAVEKPFGRDLASAKALDQALSAVFPEVATFRIDHFLGKEAVQNLLYFRFANSFLEPIWNRDHIDHVEITMAERFGVEGRGEFYDEVGAIRDVLQNHLLQLVAILAMDPPVRLDSEAVRDEKARVMSSIVPLEPARVVRGQFDGYLDEPGVAAGSKVETFVAVDLRIDSWRWAGVPFLVRSGKHLPLTATEVLVRLKKPPSDVFGEGTPRGEFVRFRLGPEVAIGLGVRKKSPGDKMVGEHDELLAIDDQRGDMAPYDRLLGDALRGDPSLFGRAETIEAQWRIVEPVLGDVVPVHRYRKGSWGPDAAQGLAPRGWHSPVARAEPETQADRDVPSRAATTRFTCTLDEKTARPLRHAWEHTIGSGHAPLALRADWQRQLARCRRELGVHHARFHALLSDDMGTLVCENDALVYSFLNVDRIFDALLSIDVRPFVELSFMPTALSSGADTVFRYRANITPPKSAEAWGTLIHKLVRHWAERYGTSEVRRWLFEVWNEPNLPAFWTGGQVGYFDLYARTARAIKAVDPSFAVGGPATAGNAWIPEFLSACEAGGLPVDFVSTHHYPTDAFGQPGDDTISQLAQSRRSVLRDQATKAKREACGKPLYYTEWSTSSNPFDDLHDAPYAAAFIVKTCLEADRFVEGYSYWTFSDLFEENYLSSKPFHGGFGLLTVDGVPKPSYRAFELLHRLGDRSFVVEGSHPTVDVWVTRREDRVTIAVTNGALPRHPVRTERIALVVDCRRGIRSAFVERVDETHANAKSEWVAMGQPERPLPCQVEALEAASALTACPVPFRSQDGGALFELTIPAQGTLLLTIELE